MQKGLFPKVSFLRLRVLPQKFGRKTIHHPCVDVCDVIHPPPQIWISMDFQFWNSMEFPDGIPDHPIKFAIIIGHTKFIVWGNYCLHLSLSSFLPAQ